MPRKSIGVIRCLPCFGLYHQVTRKFTPKKRWHGGMFKLLPLYGPEGYNWTSFPESDSAWGSDLTCPNCGEVYTRQNTRIERLVLKDEEKKKEEGSEGKEETTKVEETGE